MLQKYPENRISAKEALEHKWFKMNPEEGEPPQLKVMKLPVLEKSTPVNMIKESNIKMNFDEQAKIQQNQETPEELSAAVAPEESKETPSTQA